jgi:hypothetical protein
VCDADEFNFYLVGTCLFLLSDIPNVCMYVNISKAYMFMFYVVYLIYLVSVINESFDLNSYLK